VLPSRTSKRSTVPISYADDAWYDDDDGDLEGGGGGGGGGSRRAAGLRSLRREAAAAAAAAASAQTGGGGGQDKSNTPDRQQTVGRELTEPVEVQGIWREWMTKPKLGK
jgi:chromatin structure-remodeling complex subunit SFH1